MTEQQKQVLKNNEMVIEALKQYLLSKEENKKYSDEEINELLQKTTSQMENLKLLWSLGRE